MSRQYIRGRSHDMKNATFELKTFSAAEAEAITGVSGQVQRDWRRRKILPEIKRLVKGPGTLSGHPRDRWLARTANRN